MKDQTLPEVEGICQARIQAEREKVLKEIADKVLRMALSQDDLPANFDAPTPQAIWDRYSQEIVTILRGKLPEKTE